MIPDVFSKRTIGILLANGWNPDYRFDPEHYRASLKNEGFGLHPAAIRFISRFGGLVIKFRDLQFGGVRTYEFDLVPQLEGWTVVDVINYPLEEEEKEAFVIHASIPTACLIRYADDGMVKLYVDAGDTFWLCVENGQAPVGRGADEFVENMFGGTFVHPMFLGDGTHVFPEWGEARLANELECEEGGQTAGHGDRLWNDPARNLPVGGVAPPGCRPAAAES